MGHKGVPFVHVPSPHTAQWPKRAARRPGCGAPRAYSGGCLGGESVNAENAYAEAVAALLDATPGDAVRDFDRALVDAQHAGLVDPETARQLRWLQRESVRAVRDHAAVVIPSLLTGLIASHAARSADLIPDTADKRSTLMVETLEPAAAAAEPMADPAPSPEARRRTLVAGLLALPDSASA